MDEVIESKRVIVFRGLPGSGKSTMAKWLAEMFAESCNSDYHSWVSDCVKYYGTGINNVSVAIHSTDEYFMVDGVYQYNASKIGLYHNQNYKAFRESIDKNISLVIVDNTNTTESEHSKYRNYAEDADYWVSYMVMPHPTLDEAVKRNTHNVPADVIKKMINRFE